MIRVLIVDDSPFLRAVLKQILQQDPDIDVIGMAADPYEARSLVKSLNPDVLTLDIEMPRMNGLTFLRNLMRLRPTPVVMVSSLTSRGAAESLEALELGAVTCVAKPSIAEGELLDDIADEIRASVKLAHKARLRVTRDREAIPRACAPFASTKHVIAIGASTGGTEAIRQVLEALPSPCPPTLIVQHLHVAFHEAFAARLDAAGANRVRLAAEGDVLDVGNVYVAPPGAHLKVALRDGMPRLRLSSDPLREGFRPAVDILFESLAETFAWRAQGVLLTGMGRDGAAGLLRMREAGAGTIAQDEASSIVWGMPGAAVRLGAAEHVLPLERIADAMIEWAPRRRVGVGA